MEVVALGGADHIEARRPGAALFHFVEAVMSTPNRHDIIQPDSLVETIARIRVKRGCAR
ncbi:hypothetical protein [Paraburkholderia sp. WC7.3d]|uniref:hypothetical protein n=1 Tax=Paraburkholderia sp. WC7.3d TaxID=2991069 RepID=UPI003D23503D